MQYKAIIWDLDGTLLDTLQDLTDSVNVTLKKHNMPSRTREEVRAFVGNGMRRLIEQSVVQGCTEAEIDTVLADYNTYYAAHCQVKTAPYEGIIPLLTRLKSAGIRSAVVSNKSDYAVKPLAEQYFPTLLDAALGVVDGVPRKPQPDMVNRVLEQWKLSAEEVLYIGDSEVDIMTAANAGTGSVIVTWGFRTPEQLQAAGAVTMVHTVEELTTLLCE